MSLNPSLTERPKPAGSSKKARIRLSSWFLGVLAISFYFGVIAWHLLRGFDSGAVN
jgi:hypothetical protein